MTRRVMAGVFLCAVVLVLLLMSAGNFERTLPETQDENVMGGPGGGSAEVGQPTETLETAGATVSGCVVDLVTLKPVTGQVTVWSEGRGRTLAEGVVDAGGRFGVRLGPDCGGERVELDISCEGYRALSMRVVMSAEVVDTGLHYVSPSGSVSGRVTNLRGDPIVGATVSFRTETSPSGQIELRVESDSGGDFHLVERPSGPFDVGELRVSAMGYATRTVANVGVGQFVPVLLEQGGVLHFVVRSHAGEALDGCPVAVAFGETVLRLECDDCGRCSIAGMPFGQEIRIKLGGHAGWEVVRSTCRLESIEGDQTQEFGLHRYEVCEVVGRVVCPELVGAVPTGKVYCTGLGPPVRAVVSKDGVFTFRGSVIDTRDPSLEALPKGQAKVLVTIAGGLFRGETDFVVPEHGGRVEVVVQASSAPGYGFFARVRDPAGNPVVSGVSFRVREGVISKTLSVGGGVYCLPLWALARGDVDVRSPSGFGTIRSHQASGATTIASAVDVPLDPGVSVVGRLAIDGDAVPAEIGLVGILRDTAGEIACIRRLRVFGDGAWMAPGLPVGTLSIVALLGPWASKVGEVVVTRTPGARIDAGETGVCVVSPVSVMPSQSGGPGVSFIVTVISPQADAALARGGPWGGRLFESRFDGKISPLQLGKALEGEYRMQVGAYVLKGGRLSVTHRGECVTRVRDRIAIEMRDVTAGRTVPTPGAPGRR